MDACYFEKEILPALVEPLVATSRGCRLTSISSKVDYMVAISALEERSHHIIPGLEKIPR